MHRARYELELSTAKYYHCKNFIEAREGVRILDLITRGKAVKGTRKSQLSKSKIYTQTSITVNQLVETMKNYLQNHYSIEKDTLTVEVCNL